MAVGKAPGLERWGGLGSPPDEGSRRQSILIGENRIRPSRRDGGRDAGGLQKAGGTASKGDWWPGHPKAVCLEKVKMVKTLCRISTA